MTKEKLREIYLNKRKALPESEYTRLNTQLYSNFFDGVDLSAIKVLHVFLPLEKNKEPDTWAIIETIQKENPGIQISIPRANTETERLENFFFEGNDQLQPNKWGIPEPLDGISTESKSIDMVLVPMLILDTKGNRIGYGKGYYDKFLAECRPDCKRVGISLFEPENLTVELDELDVPLHCCVTPSKVYTF